MKAVVEYFVVRRAGRNRGIIAAFDRWPFQIIRHRGWGDSITRRPMTSEEVALNKQRTRYHSEKYQTLELLLEDERRVLLPDHKAIYDQLERDLRSSPTVQLYETDPKPADPAPPAPDADDMAAD